jgi:hypothetical protein
MLINLELLIDSYTQVREQYATSFLTKEIELEVIPRMNEVVVLEEIYVNVNSVLHVPGQPPVLVCSLMLESGDEPILEVPELEQVVAALQDNGWTLMTDDEKPTKPFNSKYH